MLTETDVLALLRQAFDNFRRNGDMSVEFSEDLVISGRDGALDSLDTMYFIDQVEELIGKNAGRDVEIIGDDLFAREDNPLDSMRSLARYILERLAEGGEAPF